MLQQGLTFNRADLARSGVEKKDSSALESDTMMLLRNIATYSKRKVSLVLPLLQIFQFLSF